MAFAHPGRTQDHEILAVPDEVTRGQLLNLLFIQRRLVGEVEGLQTLHERESGETGAHGLGGLVGDFFAEHLVEEVGVRALVGGCVLVEGFEPLAALQESQARQLVSESLELGGVHACHLMGGRGAVERETADLDVRHRARGGRRPGQSRAALGARPCDVAGAVAGQDAELRCRTTPGASRPPDRGGRCAPCRPAAGLLPAGR